MYPKAPVVTIATMLYRYFIGKHMSPDLSQKLASTGIACKPCSEASLDDHLQVPGLSEQFARLADAHLIVQGKHMPVHSVLLAVGSPISADLFITAAEDPAVRSKDDGLSVAMAGHTIADIGAVLNYLYQRSAYPLTNNPSKQLWMSVDAARPIIKFAHKFNMKSVLEECDSCLSENAQDGDGQVMFSTSEAVIAWAVLAEEYGLKRLLACTLLFMVKALDPGFWQPNSFANHNLSQACWMRLMQAAQHHMRESARIFQTQQQTICPPAHAIPKECYSNGQRLKGRLMVSHQGWCVRCNGPPKAAFPAGGHVSIATLMSWSEQ